MGRSPSMMDGSCLGLQYGQRGWGRGRLPPRRPSPDANYANRRRAAGSLVLRLEGAQGGAGREWIRCPLGGQWRGRGERHQLGETPQRLPAVSTGHWPATPTAIRLPQDSSLVWRVLGWGSPVQRQTPWSPPTSPAPPRVTPSLPLRHDLRAGRHRSPSRPQPGTAAATGQTLGTELCPFHWPAVRPREATCIF